MRRAIVLLLAIAACESDEKKLARLKSEELTACLLSRRAEQLQTDVGATPEMLQVMTESVEPRRRGDTAEANRLDSVRREKFKSSGLDTLVDQAEKAKIRCDLATRELNRFMR